MGIKSLDHVGIVVDDLAAATTFFVGLGMSVLGEGAGGSAQSVQGDWVDRVVGIEGLRVQVAMLQTPDGDGRLELTKFHVPAAVEGDGAAPPNTLGIRRVAFSVDDVDGTVATVRQHGGELIGEVVNFENAYRLCYVRGPEGIIVMLAQPLADASR